MTSFDADDALAEEAFGAAPAVPFVAAPQPEIAPAPNPEPDPEPEQEELPEFDPRYRHAFEGLLFLGQLSDEVVFWGHQFQLVTPSTADRLEMGLLTREYEGTIAFEFAYSTALVAAYLVQVDGVQLPQPITNNAKDTSLLSRWNWVRNTLQRPVIEALFQECYKLDAVVRKVLEAMGKA